MGGSTLVVAVVALTLIGGLTIAPWARRTLARHREEAMLASGYDGVCAACGQTDLQLIEIDAYRCVDCDYEGGKGWTRVRTAARRAAVSELPAAERNALAERELRESLSILGGLRIRIDDAIETVRLRYERSEPFERSGDETAELVRSALSELVGVDASIRKAALCLDRSWDKRVYELSDQTADAMHDEDVGAFVGVLERMQETSAIAESTAQRWLDALDP